MAEQTITTRTTREAVLETPETWVGSIMPETFLTHLFRYDNEGNETYKIKKVTTIPAIHNCIKEGLDNAMDYAKKEIVVRLNRSNNTITIRNDVSQPISSNDAQVAFCDFRSSSNYHEGSGTKMGRNGVGIKGLNTWCKEFRFTIGNHLSHTKYTQTCRDNLSSIGSPKVTKYTNKSSFVEICFALDLDRFKEKAQASTKKQLSFGKVDRYFYDLVTRQVLDMAASCPHLKIKYDNGIVGPGAGDKTLEKGLMPYLKRFQRPVYECKKKTPASVCVMAAVEDVQMPSFVNHGLIKHGGTHVKAVQSDFVKHLTVPADLKNVKNIQKKVKDELWFVVACMVSNPVFDGQTKTTLTTPLEWPSMFSQTTVKTCLEMLGTWDTIREKYLPKKKVATQTSRMVAIPKYDPATNMKKAEWLILTEGDSAKSLAMAGLSVVGRVKYGVYPLKGKIPNVRTYKGSHTELVAITKILGLKANTQYPDTSRLLYKKGIMIMCDADASGYHIGALIMNFIAYHWPELMEVRGFFSLFQTPIVRCSKAESIQEFLTAVDFESWKSTHSLAGYRIQHLKGLGSSKISDAKRWFRQLHVYLKPLHFDAHTLANMELGFGKDTDIRKRIILGKDVPTPWGDANSFSFSGYLDRFLKGEYWHDEQHKKIPHVMDGLTQGQRKAVYFMPNKSNRTAQQAAKIAEISHYAHGETSMVGTINNFNAVYKNNICLCLPDGQFGSMDTYGGFAAARYTYTSKDPNAALLYPESTHFPSTLTFEEVEGHKNEPTYLAPILPMVLVNGFNGIAVGFSSKIPRYNPKDIHALVLQYVTTGERIDASHLVPWYRGWTGEIVKEGDKFASYGTVTVKSETKGIVTAIPVETSIQSWIDKWNKKKEIKRVTNASVFVQYTEDGGPKIDILSPAIHVEFHDKPSQPMREALELKKWLHVSNMHLWGVDGTFAKYESVTAIFNEYCAHREALYEKRRQHLMVQVQHDRDKVSRKRLWVQKVVDGTIALPIVDDLEVEGIAPPYDDLFQIPLKQLKASSIAKMGQAILNLDSRLVELSHTTARAMWKVELDAWHASFYEPLKREPEDKSGLKKKSRT